MKKRFCILVLLALIALALPLAARAATSGTCGRSLTWTLDDSGTLTISGSSDMTDYEWNGSYDENSYYVRTSTAPWGTSVKEVRILAGVTSNGNAAFLGCGSLESVMIPDTVVRIGQDAFSECTSLTDAEIPDSVTSIGEDAFADCGSALTFHCNIGSEAYQYAEAHNIRVK